MLDLAANNAGKPITLDFISEYKVSFSFKWRVWVEGDINLFLWEKKITFYLFYFLYFYFILFNFPLLC
jgi:hypothetical protein